MSVLLPDIPAEPDWNRTFIEMISPLTKQEQEIISLKFIGGFSHKEIAHITGMTVAAAKKRYERAIKRAARQKNVSRFQFIQHRRIAGLFAGVFLLAGCTVIAATTEVDYGAWASHSGDFSKAETISDEPGITIPESLDGNAFCNITTGYVVPHGTSYLEALITPAYRWYSVDYGTDDAKSLAFGSTKDALYQYCFNLNSENVWSPEHLLPGSCRTEEYKGITIQIGTVISYNEGSDDSISGCIPHVVWVDEENSTVFSLSASACEQADIPQTAGRLIGTAKEIINMNTDG